jgi:hypothetical protein
MPYKPYVYCLNPKEVANYKESFNALDKYDGIDSFVIAGFARVGRIHTDPRRGSKYLAPQRLIRHLLHILEPHFLKMHLLSLLNFQGTLSVVQIHMKDASNEPNPY